MRYSVWYCWTLQLPKFFSPVSCSWRNCGSGLGSSCFVRKQQNGETAPCFSVSQGWPQQVWIYVLTDQWCKKIRRSLVPEKQAWATVQWLSERSVVRREAWGQVRIWIWWIGISKIPSQVQTYLQHSWCRSLNSGSLLKVEEALDELLHKSLSCILSELVLSEDTVTPSLVKDVVKPVDKLRALTLVSWESFHYLCL